MPTKMYAFWASHDVEHDPPMKSKLQGFFGVGLALLGTIGVFIALLIPTMLVINEEVILQDNTMSTYNGYFLRCVKSQVQSKCEFKLFPPKIDAPEGTSACPFVGQSRDGFTFEKQHSLFVTANIFALACLALGLMTISAAVMRGLGMTRSGMLSAATSFACGLSGCLAIILYYVATNPCKKDICTALNDAGGVNILVTCWALSPVGQVIAMLMVFVGGCCAQRWASNPRAIEPIDEVEINDAGPGQTDYVAYPAKPM